MLRLVAGSARNGDLRSRCLPNSVVVAAELTETALKETGVTLWCDASRGCKKMHSGFDVHQQSVLQCATTQKRRLASSFLYECSELRTHIATMLCRAKKQSNTTVKAAGYDYAPVTAGRLICKFLNQGFCLQPKPVMQDAFDYALAERDRRVLEEAHVEVS